MARRDQILEIEELRKRGQSHSSLAIHHIQSLATEWNGGAGPLANAPDFVVIRLVTILEVTTRAWLTELIDHGNPFVENAAPLVLASGLKFDYAIACATYNKRITIGELAAHSVATNQFSDIVKALTVVLGSDIFQVIDGVVDRYKHEILGQIKEPIIKDIDRTRADIAKIFVTRHILVHELPVEKPYYPTDLQKWIESTENFVSSVSEAIQIRLHGDYPLTQTGMTADAARKDELANIEMNEILIQLNEKNKNPLLDQTQSAWSEYRRLEAEYRSGVNEPSPGTIAPMIYALESESLTKSRIEKLRWYLEQA